MAAFWTLVDMVVGKDREQTRGPFFVACPILLKGGTLAQSDFQQRLFALVFEAASDSTPDHMRRVVDVEFALWTPVIKAIELKLD